jgi:hypothetical protein
VRRFLSGDAGERDRTAGIAGALHQVVTACVDGGSQGIGDRLKVGDLRLDFCQLQLRPSGKACLVSMLARTTMPMTAARIQQFGHLVEREPEALSRLDHAERGDGLGRIDAVPTEAPIRLGQQPPPLVVPQRLPIDTRRGGHLTAPQAQVHGVFIRDAARAAKASSTSLRTAGTRTSICTVSPREVNVNVKKEQHCVSLAARSRATASARDSSDHRKTAADSLV